MWGQRSTIMIQPPGSQHFSTELSGNSSVIAVTADSANPVTFLSARMSQSIALSETQISCGSQVLALAMQQEYPVDFPYAVCTDDIVIDKSGPGDSFVSMVFLPFNINESTGSVVLTPTPVTLHSSFTFGELTIALILIPLVLVVTYQTIIAAFRKPIVRHK